MNESCHTYEWVMSHIRMSHVTLANVSLPTDECVTVNIWMSHVTHIHHHGPSFQSLPTSSKFELRMCTDQSCLFHEWVMAHVRMSHVPHTKESCPKRKWVTAHTRMSHVKHAKESCPTCEWVMALVRMSHVTHINESWPMYEHVLESTYQWVISHTRMSHVTASRIHYHCPCLQLTPSSLILGKMVLTANRGSANVYVMQWRDSFLRLHHVPHTNMSCPTCTRLHTRESIVQTKMQTKMQTKIQTKMWRSYATHIFLPHLFPIKTILLQIRSLHTYECVMSHIWMGHVPYMNASCPIYEWVMSHVYTNT